MENNNLSILGDRHTTIVLLTTPESPFTIIVESSSIGIGNRQNQPSALTNHPSRI
jgi:hypothetical protein